MHQGPHLKNFQCDHWLVSQQSRPARSRVRIQVSLFYACTTHTHTVVQPNKHVAVVVSKFFAIF